MASYRRRIVAVVGIALGTALAAGCAGSSFKEHGVARQPPITIIDQPVSRQLLAAFSGGEGISMGATGCYSASGKRLSDAACERLQYRLGIVDNPRDVRLFGKIDAGSGAHPATGWFVTFRDDRGKRCFDIEVLTRAYLGGHRLHCSRIRDCRPVCIWSTKGGFDREQVVLGGAVPAKAATVRIRQSRGARREWRLTGPLVPGHASHHIFMLPVEKPSLLGVEVFGPAHRLLARCRFGFVCEPAR